MRVYVCTAGCQCVRACLCASGVEGGGGGGGGGEGAGGLIVGIVHGFVTMNGIRDTYHTMQQRYL